MVAGVALSSLAPAGLTYAANVVNATAMQPDGILPSVRHNPGMKPGKQASSLNPPLGVDVGFNSTPNFADLDADGDLDVFSGERYGAIKYFQNTGSAINPKFIERTGNLNPFTSIDVGSYSAPIFADLDGDGDLDAFIGKNDGLINYFQNTGSATNPAFVQRSGTLNPFNGIDVGFYCTPSFADLDGDGDLDAFGGEWYGTIQYVENTGSAVSPAFTQRTGSLNPFNDLDVGYLSAPSFADLDEDGDLDAFIGESGGTIQYAENTRSASSPIFGQRSGSLNPLDLVHVGFYSTPSFADLDADGDLDAVSGERFGTIKYFKNTGSATSPAFIEHSGSLNPFNSVDVPWYSAPSFADLDGDGDLDLFVGEKSGNVFYFENTGSATSPAFVQTTGTFNPFNGLSTGTYNAPTFADLDGDGDQDAIVGEFDPYVLYFENTGSSTSPAFVQRSGSLNPFDGFMIGNQTKPAFADLDKDGDLDAFIAEVFGNIYYYQNTGSATNPAFVKRSGSLNPFNNVIAGQYFAPTFADLDADGDLDAFIGETYGTFLYYKNILLTRQVHLPLVLR
jgi:uncharacterized protein (DUF2141 family)